LDVQVDHRRYAVEHIWSPSKPAVRKAPVNHRSCSQSGGRTHGVCVLVMVCVLDLIRPINRRANGGF
jgi:hypothetical protein